MELEPILINKEQLNYIQKLENKVAQLYFVDECIYRDVTKITIQLF